MKDKLLAAGLIASLVLGIVAYQHGGKTTYVDNSTGEKVTVGGASPYSNVDFMNFRGFEPTWRVADIRSSTSTLCAIPSPTASSTLLGAYLTISTVDTGNNNLFIATSTTPYATTTLFGAIPAVGIVLPASYQSTVAVPAASSTASSFTATVLAPNTYVVFDVKGKTSYTYTGKCYAEFRALR